MKSNWDTKMIDLAVCAAGWSKDRSTQVGCVLVNPVSLAVVSLGYNGFPRGVDDDVEARHTRPDKYAWTIHAELNAIYNAARLGHMTYGCTAVMNLHPLWVCETCAGGLIQAGVRRVIGPDTAAPGGKDTTVRYDVTKEMFAEAGVKILVVDTLTPLEKIERGLGRIRDGGESFAGDAQEKFMNREGSRSNLEEEIERRIPVGDGGGLVECRCGDKPEGWTCPVHNG